MTEKECVRRLKLRSSRERDCEIFLVKNTGIKNLYLTDIPARSMISIEPLITCYTVANKGKCQEEKYYNFTKLNYN